MKKLCIAGLLAFSLLQTTSINAQSNQKLIEIAQEFTYNKDNQIDYNEFFEMMKRDLK